jgi:hypothetical protein
MLWIRLGFTAELDSAFYLNVDRDTGSETNRINAEPDPDPGQIASQKVEFLYETYTVVYGSNMS